MCEYAKVKVDFLRMLDGLFSRLEAGDYFQTFGNCRYCDYRSVCHGLGSVPRTDRAFTDFCEFVAMKEAM